ncbi:MAG: transcription antitermination factor NusB [Anaerolineae bacterium]|nr:transcription antitermination factor NusB [Thermoflexales bacterium]MDW8406531.1 transcription antitermination factor NusB [Anaerolineae bacterium]
MTTTSGKLRSRLAPTKARREARVVALQVLYEVDTAHHQAGEVLQRHLRERAAERVGEQGDERAAGSHHSLDEVAVRDYAIRLVSGVVQELADLDCFIAECAPDFPVSSLSPIDRNILRVAVYEMRAGLVPARVAVNEAVEIAKQYGSDTSPRFVNGALGAAITKLSLASAGEDTP